MRLKQKQGTFFFDFFGWQIHSPIEAPNQGLFLVQKKHISDG